MNITLSDGTQMTVNDAPFSSRADGDLFLSDDKKYMVKLLHPDQDTAQTRQRIERLLGEFNLIAEDPSRESLFAWLDNLVIEPRMGVRMRAVDGRSLESFVSRSVWEKLPGNEKGNWLMRVYLAYQIARIGRWLHVRGLCSAGLSPANFTVDSVSGQVTLIHCDALVLPGEQVSAIFDVPGYSAPEFESGKTFASADLDKHALAVLIYQILFMRHPLLGPKVHSPDHQENERLAYGKRALYVEHPADHSNRPSDLSVTTESLPPLARELFQRAFVDGLHDPSHRPSAAEWETVLLRMADQVISCATPACSMKSYVVQDKHKFECPWCKTSYQATADLPIISLYRPGAEQGDYVFDNWVVAGWPNRALMMYHVDPQKIPEPGDASFLGAYFDLDGNGKWFIVNEALEDARIADGNNVSPFKLGDRVQLKPDLKILLGPGRGFRAGFIQMLHPVTPKKPEPKLLVPVKHRTPAVVDVKPAPKIYATDKTAAYYSESGLWSKIKKFAQQAGQDVIEKALLLYFAAQSPDTPEWAKATIYGALGYFIFPIDAIPDTIPVVGLTDDVAVLAAAVGAVAMSITPAIRMQAKKKLQDWFGKL